jgi:arylsulfatase A-like enzyme
MTNFLFVLTDDQPAHTLGVMGKTLARLAQHGGVDLTDTSYAAVPLCGPARVGLLTGLYVHNHGASENPTAYSTYRNRHHLRRDFITRLKHVGYRTGYFGKFMNGFEGDWKHPNVNEWVVFSGRTHKHPWLVNINGVERERTGNQTAFLAGRAESFIRQSVGTNWLTFLSLTDPHGPYEPANADEHTFDGARYDSEGVSEADTSDKTRWARERMNSASDAEFQRTYEGITEELQGTDRAIERLFVALEETGQLDDTVVIFTTDNGYMLGEHGGMYRKGTPYNEAVKVPMLVWGIDAEPGKLYSHLDITATILKHAGADTAGIDGRAFDDEGERARILCEHPGSNWYMMRQLDLVYIQFPDGERELYDVAADEAQNENFYAEADPFATASLESNIDALKHAEGDGLRALEE